LVVHDWGSALGFAWAQRHPERVKAIVYREGIVRPFQSWDEWPSLTRAFFEAQRSPAGEDLILERNLFIEYLLPLRGVSSEAIEVYRRYFRIPGGEIYFPLKCSSQLLARPWPLRNGRAASTNCGARPIS
jgi:haloalkane dehalogenase